MNRVTYHPRTATCSRTTIAPDGSEAIELFAAPARLVRYDAARGMCVVRVLCPGNVVELHAVPYAVARDMPGLLDR